MDGGGLLVSSGFTPLVVGVVLGLTSDGRICGRHLAMCFAAGALASSSKATGQHMYRESVN